MCTSSELDNQQEQHEPGCVLHNTVEYNISHFSGWKK